MSKTKRNIIVSNGHVAQSKYKPRKEDWGYCFDCDDELDALRIAYIHRNRMNGVKVEFSEGIQKYTVTLFNELAVEIGIDRS